MRACAPTRTPPPAASPFKATLGAGGAHSGALKLCVAQVMGTSKSAPKTPAHPRLHVSGNLTRPSLSFVFRSTADQRRVGGRERAHHFAVHGADGSGGPRAGVPALARARVPFGSSQLAGRAAAVRLGLRASCLTRLCSIFDHGDEVKRSAASRPPASAPAGREQLDHDS